MLSAQLSDKLENLMLMCADHHKLIDQPTSGPRDYPVEKLKAMKKAHEEKIDRICDLFHVPKNRDTTVYHSSNTQYNKVCVVQRH